MARQAETRGRYRAGFAYWRRGKTAGHKGQVVARDSDTTILDDNADSRPAKMAFNKIFSVE